MTRLRSIETASQIGSGIRENDGLVLSMITTDSQAAPATDSLLHDGSADALIYLPRAEDDSRMLCASSVRIEAIVTGFAYGFGFTAFVGADFEDVRSLLRTAGVVALGIGEATGEQRALVAAHAAINSITAARLAHADGVLVMVAGANTKLLADFRTAVLRVRAQMERSDHLIFAAQCDERFGDTLHVTILATNRIAA